MCDIGYLDEDDQIPAESAHKDVVRTFEIDENLFKPRQHQIINPEIFYFLLQKVNFIDLVVSKAEIANEIHKRLLVDST